MLGLSLEEFVRLSCLCKLGVDVLVLSRQCLDVFSQLLTFLRLDLDDLRRLLELFLHRP